MPIALRKSLVSDRRSFFFRGKYTNPAGLMQLFFCLAYAFIFLLGLCNYLSAGPMQLSNCLAYAIIYLLGLCKYPSAGHFQISTISALLVRCNFAHFWGLNKNFENFFFISNFLLAIVLWIKKKIFFAKQIFKSIFY